ncbi:unnamed protein product [Calypogeia fissa]
MTGLLKLRDELFSLHARQESIHDGPRPILDMGVMTEPFKVIPGADKSLKRKESFVDKFMKRGGRRSNGKNKSNEAPVERVITTAPFVRTVTMKESDQAKLDKEALKCIDLNCDPDWHFTTAMGKTKKTTEKVTSRK